MMFIAVESVEANIWKQPRHHLIKNRLNKPITMECYVAIQKLGENL